MRKKTKKWRLAEKEKIKKQMEYLQQLHDEVLVEDAILLEGMEGSQIMGTKYKEINLEDKKEWWPSKKAKKKQSEKYHGNVGVKMGDINHYERCMCTGQDCLVYNSR